MKWAFVFYGELYHVIRDAFWDCDPISGTHFWVTRLEIEIEGARRIEYFEHYPVIGPEIERLDTLLSSS